MWVLWCYLCNFSVNLKHSKIKNTLKYFLKRKTYLKLFSWENITNLTEFLKIRLDQKGNRNKNYKLFRKLCKGEQKIQQMWEYNVWEMVLPDGESDFLGLCDSEKVTQPVSSLVLSAVRKTVMMPIPPP